VATSSSPAEPPRAERRLTVGVLGSARLGPSRDEPGGPADERWELARRVGAALAGQGWSVMTGGYGGLMEAAASGAASQGGHVLGLPMRPWTSLRPSPHASQLLWCDTYPERFGHLLDCDAVVALDGGIGTIAELTVAWSVRQTEPRAPALVAAGAGWPALLATIAEQMIVGPEDLALVSTAETPEEVIAAIERQLSLRAAPLPRG
jgi:uncharacterized protein (TIGR00725 family)